MSYKQKIDIILSGLQRIDDLEQSLAAAEERAQGLVQSIAEIGTEVQQSFGKLSQLRQFNQTVRNLQAGLKIPRDERGRFVGGERRQQFEGNKRRLKEMLAEIRDERIIRTRAQRERVTNLVRVRNENKRLIKQQRIDTADLDDSRKRLVESRKRLELELKRDTVIDRFRGRVENFTRKGAGRKLGEEAIQQAKEIEQAFENIRKLPSRNNGELRENIRLLDEFSKRYTQLIRRQNEGVRLTRDRSLVGTRVASSNSRIDELERTGQITSEKAEKFKKRARAASIAVNREFGDAEAAYSKLRKLEKDIVKIERKGRTEKRQAGEDASRQRAINSIDTLQRRIERLASAGADPNILRGPRNAVAELSRFLDAGKVNRYKVAVEGARGAIAQLEESEKNRLNRIKQEQKPMGPATALGGGAELKAREKFKKESLDSLEQFSKLLYDAQSSLSDWDRIFSGNKDLEAMVSNMQDTADSAKRLNQINKENLKTWDDQLKAIEANKKALDNIWGKAVAGKQLTNSEFEQWVNSGAPSLKALRPMPGSTMGVGLTPAEMMPTGGARMIGKSREFITNAAGTRTNINGVQADLISTMLKVDAQRAKAAKAQPKSAASVANFGSRFGASGTSIFDITKDFFKVIAKAASKSAGLDPAKDLRQRNTFIGNVGKTASRFTSLVEAGGVPKNLVQPIRDELMDLGIAARKATKPIEDLRAGLDAVKNRISLFSRPAQAGQAKDNTFAAGLSGIRSSGTDAREYLNGLSPEQAIDKFVRTVNSKIPGANTGTSSAAKNVVATFASEIASGGAKIAKAGTNAMSQFKDSVKRALGIASPSRFMLEIVKNLVDTYINGMVAAYPRIQAATDKAFNLRAPKIRSFDPSGQGSEMDTMMREFRYKIAKLTIDPKTYGSLLNALPSSRITTDLVGKANTRSMMTEVGGYMDAQKMLGPGDLEKQITQAYADYAKTARVPNPWLGPVGDYKEFIAKIIEATASLKRQQLALPQARIAGALPPASSPLDPIQARIDAAYRRSDERAAAVAADDAARRAATRAYKPPVPPPIPNYVQTGIPKPPPPPAIPNWMWQQSGVPGSGPYAYPANPAFRVNSTVGGGMYGGGGGRGTFNFGAAASGGAPQPGANNAAAQINNVLLRLRDLGNIAQLSTNDIEASINLLTELRAGIDSNVQGFESLDNQLRRTIRRFEDQKERRDPNADFLTRRLGSRGAAAASEGLIGGAFPLLFGQGLGASAGGLVGGAAGGFAGGMLGFGLSLVGTAVGSAVDSLVQASIDTGDAIRDVVGNFDTLKQASIISGRSQESLIQRLIDNGRVATAYRMIQEDLNRTIGYEGMQALTDASTASDKMNRAMSELGKRIEVFIAGPLTAFLNAISGVLERVNLEGRVERGLKEANPETRKRAEAMLGASRPKTSTGSLAFDALLFGGAGDVGSSLAFGRTQKKVDIPGASDKVLRDVLALLTRNKPAEPPKTPIEQQKDRIRNSEEALAALNDVNSALSKVDDARNIAKEFKDQIIAATREQQDLDRQGADLRLSYERQIADIRRGVEERVIQLSQENKQKELQILAKQGEIREAQLRNELASLQAGFGGDELGQRLAGAVSTYLQAQMSAENQLEQRRMQFQAELSNQQLEVERYKIDVSRTIARLNLDTAKQVEQININIARRNEDMIASDFQAQKEIGKRKLQIIMNELRLTMEKNNLQLRELAALEAGGGLSQVGKDFRNQLKASDADMRKAFATMTLNYNSLIASKPPKPLKPIATPAMSNASFKALDEARRRGAALSKQFMQLEENLASIVSSGNIKQFAEELNNIAFSGFEAEFTKLNETLKSIDTNQGSTAAIVEGIDKSYTNLVAKVRALTGISEEQRKGMLDMLELSWKQQLAYEKLIPTVKKYNDLFDDQGQQIQQLKGSINELLGPVNELDKVMKYINDSGGIQVNPKLNNQLIANAKEIDRLTQKLKVLKGIKDIADGWTESFVDFNRELLKTGDLSKALEQWGERVSSKAIDLLLKFTLEPLQDQVFKQLASFFGFEAEKDPILQPVEQMALDVTVIRDKLIELAGKLSGAPVAAAATTAVPGNVQQAFKLSDQEITAAVNTAIGEYGGKDPLGRTDVFANILARSRSGEYPKNLVDVVTQPGQYAPNFGRSKSQVTDPNLYGADLFNKVKAELLNPTLLSKSINDVNGRLYFKGVSEYPNMMQGDFLRASGQNFFHGPGREPGLNPQITKQLLGELYGTPANAIVPGPSAQAVSPSTAQTQQATNVQYPQTYTAAMPASSTVAPTAGPPDSFRPSDVFADKLSNVENTLITDLYSISSGLDGFNSSIVDTSKMFTDMSGIGAKAFGNVADNIAKDDARIRAAYENRLTVENENIDKLKTIGQELGVGMQILGGIAMGIAGVQQMKKGGTYNTLMGLAGIFGAISQTSFGFGKLFGLQGFAEGGRPPLDRPSWIGEKGVPELWWPDTAGTIIPIDQLDAPDDSSYDGPVFGSGSGSSQQSGRFAATRAAMKREHNSRAASSNRDSRNSGAGGVIEVRSESTVINNVEYVTKEQHEKGMRETAKAARFMTLHDMRKSVSTRRNIGI